MIDPLIIFLFFGLFSPGPNVVLLTRSGARFGLLASVPHLLGVVLGVGILAGAVGLGIGALILAQPALQLALKILSAAWILYMAYQLWISAPKSSSEANRPMGFLEAILFQWVNPKIWAVALAAMGGFPSGAGPLGEAVRLGTAFSGTNFVVLSFWTAFGTLLAKLLQTPGAWSIFNRTMALALAAFAIMLFI